MHPTPYIPQDQAPEDLQNTVVEVARLDAQLYRMIPGPMRQPMIHLLRQVNSFYSNRIEGNPTLPGDVLRAQQEAAAPDASEDILEIKRHIDAQCRLSEDPISPVDICSRASILRIHREFYTGMPDKYLNLKYPSGEVVRLVPGEFRDREVTVGNHRPPSVAEMLSHMNWFEGAYRLDWIRGAVSPILAAAGAHHRLMWIHPFLDGNGRTGRLFTDQYLRASGLGGYGLWSINRGFGRNVEGYYEALKSADRARTSDFDGRGLLSGAGLLAWTKYFIETALDQLVYFTSVLEPKKLHGRIHAYFHMRASESWATRTGETVPKLRIEAHQIYTALLTEGPKERSEIMGLTQLTEYQTRSLLNQMATEGLISLEPRRPVSLRISPDMVETFFPNLFVGA
ncbi:Fic family protein [Pseudomonas solani]|uniref:Fic family protein n=1 Tax=Pseudomonas solani TaxID=2731552 RepID=UPI003C2F293B